MAAACSGATRKAFDDASDQKGPSEWPNLGGKCSRQDTTLSKWRREFKSRWGHQVFGAGPFGALKRPLSRAFLDTRGAQHHIKNTAPAESI